MASPDPTFERSLPSATHAEDAMIGCILLDGSLIAQAIEMVKPSMLYQPTRRAILLAMFVLFDRSEPIDPRLLIELLERDQKGVSWATILAQLMHGLPATTTIEHYAKAIRDAALLRELIKISQANIAEAFDQASPSEIILDHAEHRIFDLADQRIRGGFEKLITPANRVLEKAEAIERHDAFVTGVATGFTALDSLTSGFQPQDLVVIAARPSMGKTALALTLAQHAAMENEAVVGVFSLEMSADALAMRILCAEASVDAQKFRSGFLSNEEWARLGKALGRIADARIFIDDTPAITVLDMRAKARRLATEQKRLDMIVVDYLQLMSGATGRFESRQQEVSQISRELKALAKELKVPVVALSQLSRAPENRTDHRPQLADLRESGAIEQDADVVAFIYREEQYKRTDINKNIAELIVAKQRNGPTDTVYLAFLNQFAKFVDLDRDALGRYLAEHG